MTSRGWDSFRVQFLLILGLMTLFLGAGVFAVRHVSGAITEMIDRTAEARQRGTAATDLLIALQDAESGQRGFLLTGDPVFLGRHASAVDRIVALVRQLGGHVPDDPGLRTTFDRLAASVADKVAAMRASVDAVRRGATPSGVLSGDDERAMQDARQAAQELMRQAERDRARSAAALQKTQSQVTDILLCALVGAVLLLGAAALRLVWSRHRLRLARDGERREAKQFRAAIEHVAPGVAVFDRSGVLQLVNTRFAAALAVPPPMVAPGTRLEPIAAAAAFEPPLATASPAFPSSSEVRQGPRTLEVWRSPMPDGGQMLSVTDVTRRVMAEEVGRQAQKMDVLGQMTGGVAHDFNNLLQVVSANLELVRNRAVKALPDDTALLKRIDAASSGVARGARLTRHLLAFARRQPLAPVALDPARLLHGMEDVLQRTLGEAVRLDLVIGAELWTMRADPVQFENALLNLAINARDAMTGADGVPAGRLVVEASNATVEAEEAGRAADVAPGSFVMFAVTDSGTGMTPDQVARATEPFFTTKGEGRGTGLGLSMVLGFAKQSGGHFQLYSEAGRGTTARLYIPRTRAQVHAAADGAPAELPRGAGALVLLVEDDPGVRQAAAAAVAGLGYRVVEAENGDAALALLQSGLRPAVVFTDVVMPGRVNAPSLAREARALLPDVRVLFTSGYTQNSIVHNGQLDAGVTLLSKPWRTEELARALHGVLTKVPAKRRVLLVEDEEVVRGVMADALAEMGLEVAAAATAAGALAALDPAPDLLIADLGLPDGDGLALVEEVRRRLPDLPVVVASGQSERPAAAVVWLPKPFDGAHLREAVTAALDSR